MEVDYPTRSAEMSWLRNVINGWLERAESTDRFRRVFLAEARTYFAQLRQETARGITDASKARSWVAEIQRKVRPAHEDPIMVEALAAAQEKWKHFYLTTQTARLCLRWLRAQIDLWEIGGELDLNSPHHFYHSGTASDFYRKISSSVRAAVKGDQAPSGEGPLLGLKLPASVSHAVEQLLGLSIDELLTLSDEETKQTKGIAKAETPNLNPSIEGDLAENPPKCFISYSWDDTDHMDWVHHLATDLQSRMGIKVVLDRWEVKPGGVIPQFMETAISESQFIVVVCTPPYAQKANAGKGGVGYEKNIVSALIYQGADPHRFIPIMRGDPQQSSPTFLIGKSYIDFQDDEAYERRLEELARAIHQRFLHTPPPLGTPPF